MKEDSPTDPKNARPRSAQGPQEEWAASLHASSASGLQSIARRLIGAEQRANDSSDTVGRAAFRVLDKLRPPLSNLIGVVGFRALFSRALTLAKGEVPWLAGVQFGADGAIKLSDGMLLQLDGEDAARGGTELIAQLHGLLITFIGEPLTLRLLHNMQPEAAIIQSNPVGKQS